MSLEAIYQNAKTILEILDTYDNLLNQERTRSVNEKIEKIRDYVLKISINVQRLVKEERENVSA